MLHNLAIITVVYENYTVLKDFLRSLEKQSNKHFTLFLVDLSRKKKIITSDFFPVTYIPSINRGYSYGINLGLRNALTRGFERFCVVNNDVYFDKNFIDTVVEGLSHRPASIIGGKIYYATGFEYHKKRYKESDLGRVLWYAGGTVDWNHALTPHIGVDEVDRGQYDKSMKVDFVNGALMLFDKTVIDKVGFWDESYFLYFEDADFCERAKRKGVQLYFEPEITLWHKNSQSTGGSGSSIHQKYQHINRLRFGLKYAPFRTKIHLLKNYVFKTL